jgi:hypothetical protein
MLAHGGLGQGQDLNDLSADALVNGLEVLDDPNPCGMSQRLADTGEGAGIKEGFIVLVHKWFRFDHPG